MICYFILVMIVVIATQTPMNKPKAKPATSRKPTKHRAKDKPKRPLSAYNYFFKEQRKKITQAVSCEDTTHQKQIDPDLTTEQITKLRKDNGKVCFAQLGKIIGLR